MTRLFLSIVAVFLVGCLGGPSQPDPTRFYVLNSLPDATNVQYRISQPVSIGIGPIMLPGYLDTDRIATQTANYEIYYAEYYRWAEPLQKGLQLDLSHNLTLLTGVNPVNTFPWVNDDSQTLEIYIIVYNFLERADGIVELDVQWRITGRGGKHTFITGHKVYTQQPVGQDYEELVGAMSATVNQLSLDLARDLASVSQQALAFQESVKLGVVADEESEELPRVSAVTPAKNCLPPSSPCVRI